MNAQDLLKLYQSLPEAHGLPALDSKTWTLTSTTERLHSAPAVMSALKALKPTTGWLNFQSATVLLRLGSALPAMDEKTGILLNAEVVNAAGQSLHVRYASADAWVVTTFTPTAGNEYLADEVKLVLSGAPGGFLYYRRYWQIDPAQGIIPCAACFTRIADK